MIYAFQYPSKFPMLPFHRICGVDQATDFIGELKNSLSVNSPFDQDFLVIHNPFDYNAVLIVIVPIPDRPDVQILLLFQSPASPSYVFLSGDITNL